MSGLPMAGLLVMKRLASARTGFGVKDFTFSFSGKQTVNANPPNASFVAWLEIQSLMPPTPAS